MEGSARTRNINEDTHGVFVISATPFTEAGEIDLPSTDSLLEFYLQQRVHGITILGMMGEAQMLTASEAASFIRHVLRRVEGRVPVVVGVSNPGLAPMVELARVGMGEGAGAVLVAPTAGLHSDDQVYRYYERVCEALGANVPVVYQDYPQSTGVFLSGPTFLRIVRQLPQVVMLKAEEAPGLNKITTVRQESERVGLRRVSILSGNGALHYPQALRRGADGAMTGFAYPDVLVEVYERFRAGDAAGGEDLYDAFLPLVVYEQQPGFGLAVRKEILRRRGAIKSAAVRMPGPTLSAADREELDGLLARVEAKFPDTLKSY